MAKVEANGATIAYDDEGRGDPPFVFIHGWATDRHVWLPQFGTLKVAHRCLSIDLRGRGASSATPPYDMVTAADDVAAVVRHLQLGPAIFVGHDTGALVALLVNERHAELACGVVMGDPPLNAARAGGLETLAGRITAAASMEPAERLVESYFTETTPHDIREQVRSAIGGCPPDIAAGMLAAGFPPGERLGALIRGADSRPFMAFWGMSPAGRPEHLRDITTFLRQEPMAEAGHFFQLEQPQVTTALLRAFVDDVERDPRLQSRS